MKPLSLLSTLAGRIRNYFLSKYKSMVVALFLSCLSACSSVPSQANRDIQDAERLVKNYQHQYDGFSLRQLHTALTTFTRFDQLSRQWSAQFAIANWHIANKDLLEAKKYATLAFNLTNTLQNKAKRYASHLQLGQLNNSKMLFLQAQELAQNDIEKAIIYTHLEQYDKAYPLFSNNNDASKEDLAFLYYRYGKYKKDISSVLKARELYIMTGNKTGVIDSLFLASQLSQRKRGAALAQRALNASIESQDKIREVAIRTWLKQKP